MAFFTERGMDHERDTLRKLLRRERPLPLFPPAMLQQSLMKDIKLRVFVKSSDIWCAKMHELTVQTQLLNDEYQHLTEAHETRQRILADRMLAAFDNNYQPFTDLLQQFESNLQQYVQDAAIINEKYEVLKRKMLLVQNERPEQY